jgi:exonuclease SbcC
MIKSLYAVNFRRHAELDLRFDDDRQLILIAGANGTGKSTILEAITFALWGEGRHGRRNLDTLVRRGAELEGMSVDLSFTISKDTYRVHRRRDGKSVTAVLYANDMPLVEGPLAVTAEIASLLGMDAAGFRLAVIAQQKDLDGLASLRPAERAHMITRLLRLDALTAAKNVASARFRNEREIASELRGADSTPLRGELAQVQAALVSADLELAAARVALSDVDAEILSGASVDEAWASCAQNVAHLEGALAQITARRETLNAELENIEIPEVTTPQAEMSELAELVATVERDIVHAESLERNARQHRVAHEELTRVRARTEEIHARLVQLGEPSPEAMTRQLDEALTALPEAEGRIEALRLELGALQGRQAALSTQIETTDQLGAECDHCGQGITIEHHRAQHVRLRTTLDEVDSRLEEIKEKGRETTEELTGLRDKVSAARRELDSARSDAAEYQRLLDERVELARREHIYAGQIERLDTTPVDVDRLYAQKAELAVAVAQASTHQQQVRLRDAALTRRLEVISEVAELDLAAAHHAERIEEARPTAALKALHVAHRQSVERRDTERELLMHWETEHALGQARIKHIQTQLMDADAREQRRQQHQTTALHAAAATRLLGEVSERLSAQIRPSLQGAVSALLATMSDGRFSAAKISDEYAITVEDDGKFRPLSELSGGEIDLVALAVRLALAQVVSDRHGAGGPGFLILDECFASQDSQRRQSILAALRTLRDVYSQIFLISHVENIEDAADMVISVSTDETREETEVLVS